MLSVSANVEGFKYTIRSTEISDSSNLNGHSIRQDKNFSFPASVSSHPNSPKHPHSQLTSHFYRDINLKDLSEKEQKHVRKAFPYTDFKKREVWVTKSALEQSFSKKGRELDSRIGDVISRLPISQEEKKKYTGLYKSLPIDIKEGKVNFLNDFLDRVPLKPEEALNGISQGKLNWIFQTLNNNLHSAGVSIPSTPSEVSDENAAKNDIDPAIKEIIDSNDFIREKNKGFFTDLLCKECKSYSVTHTDPEKQKKEMMNGLGKIHLYNFSDRDEPRVKHVFASKKLYYDTHKWLNNTINSFGHDIPEALLGLSAVFDAMITHQGGKFYSMTDNQLYPLSTYTDS